jgi:DNA gyrase subunit A
MLVSEHSECMVISQFGKIIRIETSQIREAGRSTQGVRLLNLDSGDRVAASVVIPQEEVVGPDNGTLLQ